MALNSWPFLLLVLCATLLVPVAPGRARGALFLTLNLLFAWSYWGWQALPLGLGFCLTGFGIARVVKGRGTVLLVGGLAVLTVIFIVLRGHTATATSMGLTHVVAVAGLSFLCFKMIHVVVDTAGGAMEPPHLGSYLNYCLNFTTFLMGPLQRYQDFAAQWGKLGENAAHDFETQLDAANRILRGLVKAFALAPWLSPLVLRPGLPIESLSATVLLLKTYAFYLYLYLDFSGYCDIVIGVGALMGIRPPENFRFPFTARNVSAYWLRVHRSLTLWLTDYVFNPTYRFALRTNFGRHLFAATAVSLIVTMLVAGLWHGLTFHFAVFGLVHGVAFVFMRGYETLMIRWMGRARFRQFSQARLVTAAAVFLTYNFTSFTYMFFVLDVGDALRVLGHLTSAFVRGAA